MRCLPLFIYLYFIYYLILQSVLENGRYLIHSRNLTCCPKCLNTSSSGWTTTACPSSSRLRWPGSRSNSGLSFFGPSSTSWPSSSGRESDYECCKRKSSSSSQSMDLLKSQPAITLLKRAAAKVKCLNKGVGRGCIDELSATEDKKLMSSILV